MEADDLHWSEFDVREGISGEWVVLRDWGAELSKYFWIHCDGSVGAVATPGKYAFPTRKAAESALEVYRRKQEGEPPFKAGDVVERVKDAGELSLQPSQKKGYRTSALKWEGEYTYCSDENHHLTCNLRLITPAPRDETTKEDDMDTELKVGMEVRSVKGTMGIVSCIEGCMVYGLWDGGSTFAREKNHTDLTPTGNHRILVQLTPEELELVTALSNVANTQALKSVFKKGGYPGFTLSTTTMYNFAQN